MDHGESLVESIFLYRGREEAKEGVIWGLLIVSMTLCPPLPRPHSKLKHLHICAVQGCDHYIQTRRYYITMPESSHPLEGPTYVVSLLLTWTHLCGYIVTISVISRLPMLNFFFNCVTENRSSYGVIINEYSIKMSFCKANWFLL